MIIALLKLVIVAVLVFWIISTVTPLIPLPPPIWVLINILVFVWFVLSLIKLF